MFFLELSSLGHQNTASSICPQVFPFPIVRTAKHPTFRLRSNLASGTVIPAPQRKLKGFTSVVLSPGCNEN